MKRTGLSSQLLADPDFAAFVQADHYAEPLDLDALADRPTDTLGYRYREWIVDNGLTEQIAMDYRRFHAGLAKAGMLDGMPEALQYAVLRGFQIHDFLHVLTGYAPSPQGEIALQAFCLAQLQFPYFAMWMSTVTAQMTYLNPQTIVPLMDAISAGWSHGRATPQLQLHRWEQDLKRPLEDVRAQWEIVPAEPPLGRQPALTG